MLHGVPAADFLADELLYLPRNPRPHRLYGMSPAEQVALTVNIALRRDMATLDYYRLGSTPDAFATLPKDWTLDQIRQFQDYFDALMSGNLARRTLRTALMAWASEYDAIRDMNNPSEAGFKTREAAEAFKATGYDLVERLQRELGPNYTVTHNIVIGN